MRMTVNFYRNLHDPTHCGTNEVLNWWVGMRMVKTRIGHFLRGGLLLSSPANDSGIEKKLFHADSADLLGLTHLSPIHVSIDCFCEYAELRYCRVSITHSQHATQTTCSSSSFSTYWMAVWPIGFFRDFAFSLLSPSPSQSSLDWFLVSAYKQWSAPYAVG